MRVRVRLFAALREQLGRSELDLELDSGATAEVAWGRLVELQPELAPRRKGLTAAVNRSYAAFDQPLSAGDELVFIPPVGGG